MFPNGILIKNVSLKYQHEALIFLLNIYQRIFLILPAVFYSEMQFNKYK